MWVNSERGLNNLALFWTVTLQARVVHVLFAICKIPFEFKEGSK